MHPDGEAAKGCARLRTGQDAKQSLPKISAFLLRDVETAGFSAATHTMPRQRSKKLSAGQGTAKKPAPELERESRQYESENDSINEREKGSDEEELDNLVFGDQTGFQANLGHGMDIDQADGSQKRGSEEEEGEEEEGLENVNDADVGSFSTLSRN